MLRYKFRIRLIYRICVDDKHKILLSIVKLLKIRNFYSTYNYLLHVIVYWKIKCCNKSIEIGLGEE